MTGKNCYICKNSYKKDPQISLHRFPAEKDKRKKWLEALELEEHEVRSVTPVSRSITPVTPSTSGSSSKPCERDTCSRSSEPEHQLQTTPIGEQLHGDIMVHESPSDSTELEASLCFVPGLRS